MTVIAAGDNVLVRRLTAENDGYSAVQVGFGTQKESRLNKRFVRRIQESRTSSRRRFVREFRLEADLPEGEVNLSVTQFQAGRFCRRDRPLEGQRFSGRDEET